MCDKLSLLPRAGNSNSNSKAAALANAVLALCVLLLTTTTMTATATTASAASDSYVNATDIVAEVQQFKNVALTRFDEFEQDKLPARKRAEGDALRAEMVQQLEHCAQLATSKEEMWRFRQCGAEVLGNSMATLAMLVKAAYTNGVGGTMLAGYTIWLNALMVLAIWLNKF